MTIVSISFLITELSQKSTRIALWFPGQRKLCTELKNKIRGTFMSFQSRFTFTSSNKRPNIHKNKLRIEQCVIVIKWGKVSEFKLPMQASPPSPTPNALHQRPNLNKLRIEQYVIVMKWVKFFSEITANASLHQPPSSSFLWIAQNKWFFIFFYTVAHITSLLVCSIS